MPSQSSATGRRSALEILRHAQRLVHSPDDLERSQVVREMDVVISALVILPDLHVQVTRRLEVLFPGEL